jgi:hypothetical protein
MGFLWDGEAGWDRPRGAILSLSFMMLQPSPHWAMWSDATSSLAPRRRYCQQRPLQIPGNRVKITALMKTQLPQTCLTLNSTSSVVLVGWNYFSTSYWYFWVVQTFPQLKLFQTNCKARASYLPKILLNQCTTINTKFLGNAVQWMKSHSMNFNEWKSVQIKDNTEANFWFSETP